MTGDIKSYEDLDVWQRGIDLAVRLYDVAALLPKSEQYELSSQLRRAAVPFPLTWRRDTPGEYPSRS